MNELRTGIVLTLSGNLEARAKRYSQSLEGFSRRGQRSMAMLRRSMDVMGAGLDRLGNKYTALLSGAAGLGAAKMVMDLEMRFTRLGITANVSANEVDRLKKSIYETAQAPDIRVDPGEITSAIEGIIEKTGDLKFAQDNLRNIGLAIQATGAAGQDIGEILAEFQKMDIKSPDKVLEALDVLNVQGKEGAFTLQNLAALGPRVITAYTATGRGGAQALREMGAALQVIRMGTGSSEMAATAFEAVLRTLTDPKKIKDLQQLAGVSVFDPEKLKAGQRVLRPINELMVDIIQKTKGDKVKLGAIFDAEAVRAFNQAAGEFQRTGRLDSLEKFMSVHADGATTTRDSARAADTASAALTNLYTAWKKFTDSELTGPIQSLADKLNSLEPGTVDRWMKVAKWVAIIGGGLVIGRKVYQAGKSVAGMFGKGGVGGAAGAAGGLAGMPLPLPVYIVNKHMSLTPDAWGGGKGGPAGGPAAAGKAGMAARAGQVLKMGVTSAPLAAVGGGVAAAGLAGYGVGTLINDYLIDGTKLGDSIGRNIAVVMATFGHQGAKDALAADGLNRFGFKVEQPALKKGGPKPATAVRSASQALNAYGAQAKNQDVQAADRVAKNMDRAAEKMSNAKAKVEVEFKGAPVAVRSIRAQNMDVDVASGLTMSGS